MDEPEVQPVKRQGPRITHHEIKAMKAVEAKEPPVYIAFYNKLKTMVTDLISSVASIFAPKNVSQCAQTGHVFPKGSWEGAFPHCTHCGEEIRSADDAGSR